MTSKPEQDAELPKHDSGTGVRLVVSNAVVAAIVSAIVTIATGRTDAPKVDETAIVERVSSAVMRQAELRFVDRELVTEKLRAIADKVDAIDRRTADLPRMAAELSLMRSSGK